MSVKTDLDADLQDTYLAYHQDGLIDVFVGLGVLGFGIGIAAEQAWFAALWPILMLPLWQSSKRAITARRLDDEALAQSKQAERGLQQAVLIGLAALGVVTLGGALLFWAQITERVSPGLQAWLDAYLVLTFGLCGGLFSGVVGLLCGIKRFYVYALALAVVFVAAHFLGTPGTLSLALAGGVVFLSGLLLLGRFLRKCRVTA